MSTHNWTYNAKASSSPRKAFPLSTSLMKYLLPLSFNNASLNKSKPWENTSFDEIPAILTTDLHLHTARGSIDLSHPLLAQSINVYQPGISFMMHEEGNYRAEFCHIPIEKMNFILTAPSILLCTLVHTICGRIWQKGTYHANRDFFLLFFKPSSFQGHRSHRFPSWFVESLGLLLCRSNVRS